MRTLFSPVVTGVALVMLGCILNNISLELIVREEPHAGTTITFSQFLFISFEGLLLFLEYPRRKRKPNRTSAMYAKRTKRDASGRGVTVYSVHGESNSHDGVSTSAKNTGEAKENIDASSPFCGWFGKLPRLKPRTVPITHYLLMVVLFWLVSVLNNAAFGYQIPVPLHMIFRSGSLITSAVLGWAVYNKRYSTQKIVAIASVTLGVAIATTASASAQSRTASDPSATSFDVATFSFGIFILFSAMVLSSLLGLYQEYTYKKFQIPGQVKPFRETMFYSHLLSLPLFLAYAPSMTEQFLSWRSDTLIVPLCGELPRMWVYLFCNVVTQYLCIRGVFILTGNLTALSTTLTITVRKFVSLLITVMWFNNPFTPQHWMGTAFVFGGTMLYVLGG